MQNIKKLCQLSFGVSSINVIIATKYNNTIKMMFKSHFLKLFIIVLC